MSNYSDRVEKLFKKCFPSYRIKKEKYVFYNNTKLFFDFFIPEMALLIEVNGDQHYSFNKFYHNSKDAFLKQKFYDKLKSEWSSLNGYKLMSIDYRDIEDLGEDQFKQKVINFI